MIRPTMGVLQPTDHDPGEEWALRARQDHVSVVLVRECALVPVSHRSALRALDLPGGSIALIYSKSIHPRLEDTALGCTAA